MQITSIGVLQTQMTDECRLCVAILARISDTCQESVPLLNGEGADFVFLRNIFHNDKHCEPQITLLSHQ